MHAPRGPGQRRAAWLCALVLLLGAHGAAAEPIPYHEERVALRLADGRALQARLRFPTHGHAPYPAVMLFGGFQGAARVLDRVHTDAAIVFATFDYPFDAPRKFVFPDSLKLAPEMKAAIHGTLEGVGALYEALRARPDIDPARISIAGASAGAPIATVAAAQHRIPGLVIVHGFGEVTRVVAHQFIRKWGRWSTPLAWLLAWFCTWYTDVPAPEDFATRLRAGQRTLMIAAERDSFVPARASEALRRSLAGSGTQFEHVMLPGDHVGRSEEQIARMIERALVWMRRVGLA